MEWIFYYPWDGNVYKIFWYLFVHCAAREERGVLVNCNGNYCVLVTAPKIFYY